MINMRFLKVIICLLISLTEPLSAQYSQPDNRNLWSSSTPLWISRKIKSPAPTSSYFGVSSSLSNNLAIIGAPGTCGYLDLATVCNPLGEGNGTAYIYQYVLKHSKWELQATLTAPVGAMAFGWSVELGKNLALVSARRSGAIGQDFGFDSGHGSAYMYQYNSTTGWKLIHTFSEVGSVNFGNSMSMRKDGSLLAIGAPSRCKYNCLFLFTPTYSS